MRRSAEFKLRIKRLLWPFPGLITLLFRKVTRIFASRPAVAPVPDRLAELPHPGNRELFASFKPFYEPEIEFGSYNVHPDLGERLYELGPREKVICANAYGFPVIANPHSLVFAWAKGSDRIFIRLNQQYHEAARIDRGRINTEYGKDWMEFPAWWGPLGPSPDLERSELEKKRSEYTGRLRHWMQAAYEVSLKTRD